MIDTEIIKWLAQNWPSVIIALMIAATYTRVSNFSASQQQINKRVLKLAKLHASRHLEDAAYIYDDTQE